jgi:glycosyltransferase involved in cell wall biosynthesis
VNEPCKRTESGTPTLSVCMIARNCASTICATLKSIRERAPQAEIVIVDTMSSDETPEIAKRYADKWVEWAGPKGDWTRDMEWFDDAAAARQKAFDLASGTWRMWLDSVTGETPIVVRRTGSEHLDYIEIRDLIPPSVRECKELCYERADYEVLTDQGWQRIRGIKQHRVKKPVFRITDEGDVRVTEDHSLMAGGQPVLGRDVRVGTRLDHYGAPTPWGLQVESMTVAQAEVFGLFAAEGWASDVEAEGGRGLWGLYNTDHELIERAKATLEAIHARPFRVVVNTKGDDTRAECLRLEPQDPRDLAIWYRERFYSSEGRKKVPREVLNGSPAIMAAFVLGYEMGDGHVRRTTRTGRPLQEWSTNSPLLAAGLVYLYRCLGRDMRCNPPRPDKPNIVSCIERSGERSGRSATITLAEAKTLRARYEASEDLRLIAQDMGIDWSNVYRHLRGEVKNYTDAPSAAADIRTDRAVRAIVAEEQFVGWVYDLNTEAGTFVGGVGNFVLHNSDDVVVGPEEAERLLKLNDRWKPNSARNGPVVGDGEIIAIEEFLKKVNDEYPHLDCLWAPYLYQRDEHDHAITWQSRERIVKWSDPPKYHWAEKAHEVLVPLKGQTPTTYRWKEEIHELLVPVTGHKPTRGELAHLLILHEKKFDQAATEYSMRRHYDVLLKQYNGEERTTRRCLYLAAYAPRMAPESELEFILAAHTASTIPLDRYRSLMHLGVYHANRGLLWDALEDFSASTHMRPDLPDAWLAGAGRWALAEDHGRAIDWLERGLALPYNTVESYISARDIAIRYPTLLALELRAWAKLQVKSGKHEEALLALTRAVEWANKVWTSDAAGEEAMEAQYRLQELHNEQLAQEHAIAIGRLAEYLFANDEPLKGVELLKAAPWNLRDHPIIVALEKRVAPILRHVYDAKAYFDFYNDTAATGAMASGEDMLEVVPEHGAVKRAVWIADWLNRHMPNATVLDLGAFDGIVGLPLLRLAPGIRYYGLEPSTAAYERLKERLSRLGFADRAHAYLGLSVADMLADRPATFDAIIFSEVIEHVATPEDTLLRRIDPYLKEHGVLFITTPWGSFDAGHPPPKTGHGTPRDSRGHLRAFTPRELTDTIEFAGFRVEDLHQSRQPASDLSVSTEIHVVARKKARPLAVVRAVVPGALWEWNASTVLYGGMGASESTIVYLMRELAKGAQAEVFGPVPAPEISEYVRYWPREQLRHARDGKLIISRGPSFGPHLNEQILAKPLPQILWVQDAYYPDATSENLNSYEKIVAVSDWHREQVIEWGADPDRVVTLYNFILPEWFRQAGISRKRDHFVYTSSPDRGLVRLLELWPRIRERLPSATLDIFYGWRGCQKLGAQSYDAGWTKRYERTRRLYETIKLQPGVTEYGMVDHFSVARAYLSAGVWAYPSGDRQNGMFPETCCAAAIAARAAGAVPVCPPIAALEETAACDQGFFVDFQDDDSFIDACVLASEVGDDERRKMAEEAIAKYSLYGQILEKWKALLGV